MWFFMYLLLFVLSTITQSNVCVHTFDISVVRVFYCLFALCLFFCCFSISLDSLHTLAATNNWSCFCCFFFFSFFFFLIGFTLYYFGPFIYLLYWMPLFFESLALCKTLPSNYLVSPFIVVVIFFRYESLFYCSLFFLWKYFSLINITSLTVVSAAKNIMYLYQCW